MISALLAMSEKERPITKSQNILELIEKVILLMIYCYCCY